MLALPVAAASVHSLPAPLIWGILACLIASLVINVAQQRTIRKLRAYPDPEDYEFPGWGDGHDVHEALTDPDLEPLPEPAHGSSVVFPRSSQAPNPVAAAVPTYGFVRDIEPELSHDEPVPDTVIFGRIVDEDHWAQEAAIPAPDIVANPVHVEKALAWIDQWEREDKARQAQLALAGVP